VIEYHRPDKFNGYAISGTPADCVKIAIKALAKEPDIIVSGINHGSNTATNVLIPVRSQRYRRNYLGIPSIASSLLSFDHKADASYAAEFTARLAKTVMEKGLPADTLLNVNIPALKNQK